MNSDLHTRAQQLIAQERIEGISRDEQAWLSAHLSDCLPCSAIANQTADALASLRAIPVDLPRNLASRTQLRVRLRADELRERAPGRKILWVLAFMSWALGVSTAPFVWRVFAWAGSELGLPRLVSETGAVLWWTLPVLLAVGLILIERRGRAEFSE
jgi:predicted anti-sigma-YlaC factor YlaD